MLGLNKIWKITSEFLGPTALVLAVIFGVVQCNRANRAERSIGVLTPVISSEVPLDTFRDVDGNHHAKFTPNRLNRKDLNSVAIDSVGSETDSLMQLYKDKINELTIINSQLRTKNKGTRKGDQVSHEDKTIKWVFDLKTDSLDLIVDLKPFYLKYTDGTKILGFNVGTQTMYTDFWWNDPRILINSVNSIKIENQVPKNTLSLAVGSEYRFANKDLLAGPELELNMDRWSLNGKYLYNFNSQGYEPVVGLKFHVFK